MIGLAQKPLAGKKGFVRGIANEHSLAYGCAKAFRTLGADLAVTYLNDKAKPFVEPLAKELDASLFLSVDVREPHQLEHMLDAIARTWGRLDFALHANALAHTEDLQGRPADRSRDGSLQAIDVSCHSFMRLARLAAPLMREGGALFTLSYYGAEKVIEHYNAMAPSSQRSKTPCATSVWRRAPSGAPHQHRGCGCSGGFARDGLR